MSSFKGTCLFQVCEQIQFENQFFSFAMTCCDKYFSRAFRVTKSTARSSNCNNILEISKTIIRDIQKYRIAYSVMCIIRERERMK